MPRGRPQHAAPQLGNGTGANLAFEVQWFQAADTPRTRLKPSDDQHVARGLLFLTSLSQAFEATPGAWLAQRPRGARRGHGDTFSNNTHSDLKADYVLANLPFRDSDWRGELRKDDKHWIYGVSTTDNANYAWAQHCIHHHAPAGRVGFGLASGSMSSNQSGKGAARQSRLEKSDDAAWQVEIRGRAA